MLPPRIPLTETSTAHSGEWETIYLCSNFTRTGEYGHLGGFHPSVMQGSLRMKAGDGMTRGTLSDHTPLSGNLNAAGNRSLHQKPARDRTLPCRGSCSLTSIPSWVCTRLTQPTKGRSLILNLHSSGSFIVILHFPQAP